MTDKRWDGAAYQDLTTRKRWDGVSWVDLTIAKRWDGAVWQDIPIGGAGFSVTVDSTIAQRFLLLFEPPTRPNTQVVTTLLDNTVSVTGGVGPITYQWVKLSGDNGISATAPTSANTKFTGIISKNSAKSCVMRCNVTRGADTGHVDVTVTLSYETGL